VNITRFVILWTLIWIQVVRKPTLTSIEHKHWYYVKSITPQNLLNLYFILITKNNHSKLYIYDEIQNYNGSKLLTSNLISFNTQHFKIPITPIPYLRKVTNIEGLWNCILKILPCPMMNIIMIITIFSCTYD
jgi:hypothetical protein